MVAINGRQLTGPGWKGPGQNFPYGRVAIQRRGASVEELARQRQGLGRQIRKKGHLEKYNLTEAQKSRGRRSEITELRLAIKLEPDNKDLYTVISVFPPVVRKRGRFFILEPFFQ